MHGNVVHRDRIEPGPSAAVAALLVTECGRDGPLVAIPRAEIQLVARFGASARGGLDLHVFGVQQKVRRKFICAGQKTVAARFHLGTAPAVVGATASAVAGRVIGLDDLWGAAATRRLAERLAAARSTAEAVAIMERAIAERLALAQGRSAAPHLALEAAGRLAQANVSRVAADLGVSERHLRRVFREAVGMGPKEFARLARFHRALRAAQQHGRANWAAIAAAAGYYDQAHLIDEFRAIAGVTPRILLGELAGASAQLGR